jgi:hypothetical protein
MTETDDSNGEPAEDRPPRARGNVVSNVTVGRDILWSSTAARQSAYVQRSWNPFKAVVEESAKVRLRSQLNLALGTPPKTARDALVILVAEADLRAFEVSKGGKWWRRTYYILGLPAAVLAGISGASGLASADNRISAAIIALVSAGLSAAATFLDSDQRAATSNAMSGAWQELADDTRRAVLDYDAGTLKGEVGDTLLQLHRRKSRLMRGAAAIGDADAGPKSN